MHIILGHLGQIVVDQKLSINKVDLSFLSNGLYIIQLFSDEGEVLLSKKFVKY